VGSGCVGERVRRIDSPLVWQTWAWSAAQFLERLAGQGSLETFGVTPLPEPIRVQTFAPLKVVVAQS
jgi:hypothetical protein